MERCNQERCATPPSPQGAGALCAALATVLLALVHASAPAARAEPPAACFPPGTLAARPGERVPVKHTHVSDHSDVKRELAPLTPVPPELRGAVRRVTLPPGRKLIALTFDLCEQPGEVSGYDGAIVDVLRANRIKATLFVGGKWMASHPERTRQLMTDPLFELANHAYAHRNLRLLSGAPLRQEIEAPQRIYEAQRETQMRAQCMPAGANIAPRLTLFRFPYGACNSQAIEAVNAAGLVAVQWSLSTGDPSPATSAHQIEAALLRARPGDIVIAHANGRGYHTAAALPAAIQKLRANGYEFATVSELIAAGRPLVEPICYDARPGDTDRYDRPLLRPLSRVAQGAGPKPAQPAAAGQAPATGAAPTQNATSRRGRPSGRAWQSSEGQWQMRILRGD